jgi:toxin ParE1/3/4
MKRLPVVLREEAISDLLEIYSYIAEQSGLPEQAWRFIERIRARCESIGNVPHGGRSRDDLAPGLRTVPFERSTVIAYVVEDDSVRVTNIFYGGRDYEALYSPKPIDE